jgi:hypothetical protein
MNASEKLSAPLRGAEHYNQIDPSTNVRKTLDTTFEESRSSILDRAYSTIRSAVAYGAVLKDLQKGLKITKRKIVPTL